MLLDNLNVYESFCYKLPYIKFDSVKTLFEGDFPRKFIKVHLRVENSDNLILLI